MHLIEKAETPEELFTINVVIQCIQKTDNGIMICKLCLVINDITDLI